MKTPGTATIHIKAESLTVERWTNWLYGQPMVVSIENDPFCHTDELLLRIVDVYVLAHKYDDQWCANACSDTIRAILFEDCASLQDPITSLLPMFESGCYQTRQMLVHTLAYGPCVDSVELDIWLEMFDRELAGPLAHLMVGLQSTTICVEHSRPDAQHRHPRTWRTCPTSWKHTPITCARQRRISAAAVTWMID